MIQDWRYNYLGKARLVCLAKKGEAMCPVTDVRMLSVLNTTNKVMERMVLE